MPAESGKRDPFAPPAIPVEVYCLHCGEEYDSWQIQWREESGMPDGGVWACPTPGCDGIGFGFDIHPVDEDYVGEDGERWYHFDEDEEDFDFTGFVDDAVMDGYWCDSGALRGDWEESPLEIDFDGMEVSPLKRMLSAEELKGRIFDEDIPF